MQVTPVSFPQADAAPTQLQNRPGKHCVALMRERSTLEVEMECFGVGPGLSNAIIALAVPAWHRIVHRTVFNRLDGKIWLTKFENTPFLQKDGPYLTHCIAPSDRLSTSLISYTYSSLYVLAFAL